MKEMKLYLLSIDEAEKLTQEQRECGHWWWLRSPGGYTFNATATRVSIYGYILEGGINVLDSSGGVRPALQMRSAICDELPKTEEGAVLFGRNPETGKAAEWLVIEQDRNITTLLAKECLGYHCFNGSKENGSNFADSDIAAYLNTDLLKICFSEEEQNLIVTIEIIGNDWSYPLAEQTVPDLEFTTICNGHYKSWKFICIEDLRKAYMSEKDVPEPDDPVTEMEFHATLMYVDKFQDILKIFGIEPVGLFHS